MTAAPSAPRSATPAERFDRLDALRGFAIVWMAAFHFAFDLAFLRFTQQNFYRDPFWTTQRTLIVTLFVLCAGLGQAVASQQGQRWPRFWRRWAQVAGCALLVSLGSWLVFPKSYIWFGVLHAMAVMLVLARLAAGLGLGLGLGRWLWAVGAALVALPLLVQHPFFDSRATGWIGLATRKPITEDYVPLLPWLGVMAIGLALGQWLLAHRRAWLTGALPRALRPLAVLGRWSLSFYMLHQPVLLGLLWVVVTLRR